jgi:AraC-like DNA-binding protein
MLHVYRPPPPLAFHVESLWYARDYRVPHRQERVLPNGRFQLVIGLAERSAPCGSATCPSIVGIRSRYTIVDTAALQSVIGVLFSPGGARAFIDVPAHDFYNEVIPLDLVWGTAAGLRSELQEAAAPVDKFRVLEAALLRRLAQRPALHCAVGYGLREFHREPHMRSVLGVVRETGISRRRFSQLFREQVGTTPKLYCRILRFQQVVQQIASGAPVDWADVALAGGYCDQAHLAREFREFSGLSPGAFLTADRPYPNHLAMD